MSVKTRHSKAARKAWATRRKKAQSKPAFKAWETIRPSEKRWIRKLANEYEKKTSEIIHHPAFLDIMFEHNGQVLFFEVKPEKGSRKQTMLSDKQRETIQKLLKSDLKARFFKLTYSGTGKNTKPKDRIEITLKNIADC